MCVYVHVHACVCACACVFVVGVCIKAEKYRDALALSSMACL